MNRSTIIVLGSANTDMVIKAVRIPSPGETILGGQFIRNAGGKGANQAVAAARLGGEVMLVARIGDDLFGDEFMELFRTEHLDTSTVFRDSLFPSGVALITVDEKGENSIVVAPGANAALSPMDVKSIKDKIERAGLIVMQLETPLPTVSYAASLAHQAGVKVMLNPAPACELPDDLWEHIDIITPNRKEAEMITGVSIRSKEDTEAAARHLQGKGISTVIITLGGDGACLLEGNTVHWIVTERVEAVDTTAAGDIFNGALAVGLAEDMDIQEAVNFACRAAALSVTRMGAQASAPYRIELG